MNNVGYLRVYDLKEFFIKNRKCIINTDLDGILSGMILQHFLDWEIVGYSSCSGSEKDNLWLKNPDEKLEDCVFVDLPVCLKNISVIDQHFVSFDEEFVIKYISDSNKLNPNVARNRTFNNQGECEYFKKYPFGTVHFLLALFENIGVIDISYKFDFRKVLNGFDLGDLIMRADCVISNTKKYTPNCMDWNDWLQSLGGNNTKTLFEIVKKEYKDRIQTEANLEMFLKQELGVTKDGGCTKLLMNNLKEDLKKYFDYLANCLNMKPLPLFEFFPYNKLKGNRFSIGRNNIDKLKHLCSGDEIFSYAFVYTKELSVTYIITSCGRR